MYTKMDYVYMAALIPYTKYGFLLFFVSLSDSVRRY